MIKYPDIIVKLVDTVGNAFAILGKATRKLRRNSVMYRSVYFLNIFSPLLLPLSVLITGFLR